MIGNSCFSSEFLGYCPIFDNSTIIPIQNILIIPCELQNGSSFFFFLFKLLLEVLNATVSPQFKSNCHHFSWVWVNKLCQPRVATHVISKGFSFYWVINLFGWKDNKREYFRFIHLPLMSEVYSPSLEYFSHSKFTLITPS